jgi:hypothetical protein
MTRRLRLTSRLGVLAMLLPSTAFAGRIVVENADVNSVVRVFAEDRQRNAIEEKEAVRSNPNQQVEFGLLPETQKRTESIFVCKDNQGRRIWYRLRFQPGQTNLAFHEPFRIPTFADTAPTPAALVADVDVPALFSGGLALPGGFAVGRTVTVTNGSITQVSAITFKDGSSLGPSPGDMEALRDPNTFAALPDFTGTVEVVSFDSFLAVTIPALTVWGMAALTLALLSIGAIHLSKRRSRVG